MVFLGLLGLGGAHWWAQFRESTRWLFERAFAGGWGAADLKHIAWRLFWQHLLPLALGGMAVALATLAFRLVTTRFGFSLKKLAPDPARLNPLSKLRELPRQNLPSLLQAVILLPLFLWAVYAMARHKLEEILALPLGSAENGARFIGGSLLELFWKAAGLFLVFGAVDLVRQMHRYKQDLRMSKQDIKEEMKDLEGNPQMKARIRRLQRERLRRQMMKEVQKATAVGVRPTPFAVPIRYQVESMAALVVVAKGKNYLALRIRQKAVEHQVSIKIGRA